MSSGKVLQVIGPVVDVEFPLDEKLPEINDALKIKESDGKTLTTEVALELGDGVVRTIAMIDLNIWLFPNPDSSPSA